MIPPTKVTDDPFIDDDRKPPSKSVPIEDKKIHEQTLIPVTTKMIHSAVSEDNQFVLKDGRPLHLVKVVGVIVHYHEYWKNNVIGIEDGTGKIQVVLARCRNLEFNGVKELYHKCAINTYVRVIGMVKHDFNLRTIVASDVRPEYHSAIDKKQKAICLIDVHNANDDDNLDDNELNSLITEHLKDISNEKS